MASAKIKLFSFVFKYNFNATLKTSRFAGYTHDTLGCCSLKQHFAANTGSAFCWHDTVCCFKTLGHFQCRYLAKKQNDNFNWLLMNRSICVFALTTSIDEEGPAEDYSWTRLFRIPRYFELKPISLGSALQSFTISFFELPLFRTIFLSPCEFD